MVVKVAFALFAAMEWFKLENNAMTAMLFPAMAVQQLARRNKSSRISAATVF